MIKENMSEIKRFDGAQICRIRDESGQKRYFTHIDFAGALADSSGPRDDINKTGPGDEEAE